MTDSEIYLGLPDFKITEARREGAVVTVFARYTGQILCPECGSVRLRVKDSYQRRIRHEGFGARHCVLIIEAHKWLCRDCGTYFRQQFPGILRHQCASEPFPPLHLSAALGRH